MTLLWDIRPMTHVLGMRSRQEVQGAANPSADDGNASARRGSHQAPRSGWGGSNRPVLSLWKDKLGYLSQKRENLTSGGQDGDPWGIQSHHWKEGTPGG